MPTDQKKSLSWMAKCMGSKCEIMKREDKTNFAVVRKKPVIPGSLPCGCSCMGKEIKLARQRYDPSCGV